MKMQCRASSRQKAAGVVACDVGDKGWCCQLKVGLTRHAGVSRGKARFREAAGWGLIWPVQCMNVTPRRIMPVPIILLSDDLH